MKLFASLTNRIFVATAALTVLAIAVAVYQLNVAVTAQAESELRRGLEEAGTLVEEHRTTLFEHFAREARLVADLSSTMKAAIATGDPPTVQKTAEEYQRQLASDLFVVTDPHGRVLAEAGRVRMPSGNPIVRDSIAQATSGREATALWPHEGGVLQVVAVPSYVGQELLGTVIVGSSLDAQALARFKALTNSEIAFALGSRVLASTLDPAYNDRLASLIGSRGVTQIELGGSVYAAVSRPLALTQVEGPSPGAETATALILRSRTERLRFLTILHRELALTAVLAVLAATLLSYGIARTITRPLGAITAAMREMAATGDLTRRIPEQPEGHWEDEDARLLASTFNTLTDSVARFQREAAQRERLSSLGRLSTVIAHEIRNPLMIIKTALRPLKSGSVAPELVNAAASDIDEEVARLNKIVSEVLDFARPIKFDLAPADVNAVCEEAVRAAQPECPRITIALDLDRSLPSVTTDAERLRLTLVNILSNARHAIPEESIAAAGSRSGRSGPQRPLIAVRTRRSGPGRIAIEVQDRGLGIPPEDLSRIFDPYFTTRRAGTGIGLAISRNIVEGLGGTIGISSQAGRGTEVRVELPVTSSC